MLELKDVLFIYFSGPLPSAVTPFGSFVALNDPF